MSKSHYLNQLAIFIAILILFLLVRNYVSIQLSNNGIVSYQAHSYFQIGANIILALISLYFIKKNKLQELAGMSKRKIKRIGLLLFPLIYLPVLNILFLDDVPADNILINSTILIIYCLSIGFAEELSIRGFIQSYLIKHVGTTKKGVVISVIGSAFIFGVLHLFKFDKGLYGEISQIFFAIFIGVMFGVILLLTKRIYPIIIIHAIIDFAAKLDAVGVPKKIGITKATELDNSILITLIVLPCLIYGLVLLKKASYDDLVTVNNKIVD